jgi:hypothetical protein
MSLNKINSLEIRKYLIARFGVDVSPLFRDRDLLDGVISDYTKKKAALILSEIQSKNAHDPATMEQSTIDTIHKYYELSSRGKRFAIILLLMARTKEMISTEQYKQLRELWGYNQYAPDVEQALKKPEPVQDDFSKLY